MKITVITMISNNNSKNNQKLLRYQQNDIEILQHLSFVFFFIYFMNFYSNTIQNIHYNTIKYTTIQYNTIQKTLKLQM